MQVYSVTCKESSTLKFWKEKDHKFKVIEFGAFLPLLYGSRYTLIHKNYLPPFSTLPKEQLEILPAKIYRPSTGKSWNDYVELSIKNSINWENRHELDASGKKVWVFKSHLFVSYEFTEELHKFSPDIFDFDEGFILFGD